MDTFYVYYDFSDIPSGKCAWIGAGRLQGVSSELQWIRILSNRTVQDPFTADGPLLSETYSNFAGGTGTSLLVTLFSDHLNLLVITQSMKWLQRRNPKKGLKQK